MYHIMIVEDDPLIAKAVGETLSSWGMEVHCVEDFQNVMAEFTSFAPQLVLLDISLPFYNGYYWCQEIRKISKVPVIFLSSASENMNIVMAISAGADDFVTKPFDQDGLLYALQHYGVL